MGSKANPGQFDCYAAAEPNEDMFILLARERLGGSLTRLWAQAREQMGEDPAKVAEAHDCAARMDAYCRDLGKVPADVLDLVPFEVIAAAIQRRKGIVMLEVRDEMEGDHVTISCPPLRPTLVLTGEQLRRCDQLAEDSATEVCIGFGSQDASSGPGMYAWVQGCPPQSGVALFDPPSVESGLRADLIGTPG